MQNVWIFGLVFWLVMWPLTLICVVLQYFIAKTEGKYNGMIVPGFMFIIPIFFSLNMVAFFGTDSPPNLSEVLVGLIVTVLSCAVIPLAMFWFYHLLHTHYRNKKYKKSDEDLMKIHDL